MATETISSTGDIKAVAQRMARARAAEVAKEARQRLIEEYQQMITIYYAEMGKRKFYEPLNALMEHYKPHYQNSGSIAYYGGIQIFVDAALAVNNRLPGQDHGDVGARGLYALNSWLHGYHGYPFPGHNGTPIPSGISDPIAHMLEFRDKLADELNKKYGG